MSDRGLRFGSLMKKVGSMVHLFFVAGVLASCGGSGDTVDEVAEASEKGELYVLQEPHMGTLFTIKLWLPGEGKDELEKASRVGRAAFDRIAKLNGLFSDYLLDSELSRLSRAPAGEAIPVSDELFDILRRSGDLFEASDGAFDVTVGPLIRLWRRSRKAGELPTAIQIEGARARIGFDKLTLDPGTRTVTKAVGDMVLDLGGIAKGYAADEALRILREGGYSRALVAASGDIALGDPPPGAEGWKVALETMEMAEPGEAALELSRAAVSTSGDTQRYLLIDGRRYSHIVDKNTGIGLTERISVTVTAPNATISDSYATAVSLLGVERGLALIEKTEGLECRIVSLDGEGKAVITVSSGW